MPITVAIDGPAGAGKSTVAREVARALGYTLVDTGAIYRTVALLAQRRGIAFNDDAALAPLVEGLDIHFHFEDGVNRVEVAGEDVTNAIRTPQMSMGASAVSARQVVRAGLLELQRRLAGEGNAVLEGRDIGTVVCPHAQVKVYLDAHPAERAHRRHQELEQRGGEVPPYDQVLAEVKQRDAQDMGREHAPLRPAPDALILDSTQKGVEEVVAAIVERVRAAEGAAD